MTSRHPCMWGAVARAWLVAGIPLTLAACGGSDTPPTVPPSDAPVASVSVTAASDTVLLPRTVQLTAVPKDAKGSPRGDVVLLGFARSDVDSLASAPQDASEPA